MIVLSSEEKTKFRQSKAWKDFRLSIIKERGSHCECCGTTYKSKRTKVLQLHHLEPHKYTLLEPANFVLLCSTCHRAVELLDRRLNAKKCTLINKDKWLNLYGPFLPNNKRDTN